MAATVLILKVASTYSHDKQKPTHTFITTHTFLSLFLSHVYNVASLLGPDGIQAFIDGGIPVNESTVHELVKDIVKEEITEIVREMAGKPPEKRYAVN